MRPVDVLLRGIMGFFRIFRKRGWFGVADDPIYYEAGDTVPWWIEARWPPHIPTTFHVDCETYFEDDQQVVRPLEDDPQYVIYIDGLGHSITVFGAPTYIYLKSRRPPRRLKKLILQEQI